VWRAATFLSVSEHTVDWVKQQASSPRWEATDLGRVETRGFELEAGYAGEAASIRLGYTTLAKEHDAQPYAGRYILDYPEHLLKATGAWKITPQVRLEACQGVQRQMDNAVRTGGRLGLPASLSAHLRPRSLTHLELAVSADNLWNDDFRIFPDLPTRDRRLSGALILRW
jgi:outer membrane receptor for ferrienterochelin and colicin